MNHIIIDLEMNRINKEYKEERKECKYEVIEIGAVKLDEQFNQIDQFKCYVKPQFNPISAYYTQLTGITNEMVEGAPDFRCALDSFFQWAGEEAQIYSWSDNDAAQLRRESRLKGIDNVHLEASLERWIDFQKEFGDILGIKWNVSLEAALGAANIPLEGRQHDALWDAVNTAHLFRLSKDKKKFEQVMKPILELFATKAPMTFSLGELMSKL